MLESTAQDTAHRELRRASSRCVELRTKRMAFLTLKEALNEERTLGSLRRDPARFRFLNSVHLVVATKHGPPNSFVDDNEDGSFTASGPLIDTVEVLAKSMNFTYSLVQPPDQEWGARMANGTWTGLVGMVMRNDADLVAATVCRSEARDQAVDYARAVRVARGQMLAPNGSPSIDPWGFANPFQPMVWLGLFLSLVAVWVTVLLMERKPKYSSYSAWVQKNLFIYLRIGLNQSTRAKITHEWKRLLTGSWMCLTVVLFWSYNCSLISLLSSRIITRPIQSLQDLVDHPSMGLIMERNTIFSSFIEVLHHYQIEFPDLCSVLSK
ncbi:glutamate receptor ionotropic, delta-1-like [Palaemon carinicauda]|uniref:glutamate receptor ionotropic, delta-1-like n=1 Tax=Palaemon carinicauda TaxID=392227 RepID=UPI0035B5CBA6